MSAEPCPYDVDVPMAPPMQRVVDVGRVPPQDGEDEVDDGGSEKT